MKIDNTQLPPLPPVGAIGPDVCAIVQLYLAVLDDLALEQLRVVSAHVSICANCMAAQQVLTRVTHLTAQLPDSEPSTRVDQAVKAAIAARTSRSMRFNIKMRRGHSPWLIGGLALAALLLIAVGLLTYLVNTFWLSSASTAFTLPENLNWNGYVLHHSEIRLTTSGHSYEIDSYHLLGTNQTHVETIMPGLLDIVAVSDGEQVLGKDMLHQVAQWDANAWNYDDSAFDLKQLRNELQSHQATYLGKDMFHGQAVYRILRSNGLVMLLSMNYQPVNILHGTTAEAMYTMVELLKPTMLPESLWDMSVPPNFHMGNLPPEP